MVLKKGYDHFGILDITFVVDRFGVQALLNDLLAFYRYSDFAVINEWKELVVWGMEFFNKCCVFNSRAPLEP